MTPWRWTHARRRLLEDAARCGIARTPYRPSDRVVFMGLAARGLVEDADGMRPGSGDWYRLTPAGRALWESTGGACE